MITGRIKVQLSLFVILAVVSTSYLVARYVGFNPFSSSYTVVVRLPDAGGLFVNGEVTYRGVQVGRVEQMTVTDDGMEATLRIEGDAPDIPADAQVTVANRSAIGEQYLDLRSDSTGGPYLGDDDLLAGGETSLPPAFDDVLRTGRDFVASVPEDSLTTVIDEIYTSTRGVGPHLGQLVDTSAEFAETAETNFLVTTRLIENSSTVLDTQQAASQSIIGFSQDLAVIAETLRGSDGDLRALIDSSPAAAIEIHRLFAEVGQPLGMLMGNLVSTAQVFGVNAAGIEDAFIRIPEAVSVGWSVAASGSINMGLATTFTNPLPCTTGYGGTEVRDGLDTSGGEPFNTRSGCSLTPSSGSNVRGPGALPSRLTGSAKAPRGMRIQDVTTLQDLLGGDA